MNVETVYKKRIFWKKDDLVSICLSNGLYTIAQMLDSPIMCFYNIVNDNGIWENINLNNTEKLFMAFVNNSINKDFVIGKLNNKNIPIKEINEYYFIKPYTIMDGIHYKGAKNNFPFLGGKLIDYNHKLGSVRSPIIKEDLTLPNDREIIEKYELTNMWGKHELEERLIRCFSIGINRDDLKYEVFPELWNKENSKPLTSRLPELLR
jgi:hypothetical protein